MPRIRPRDFLQAKAINPSLSTLLPVCRHLRGAQNELRWLKDHAVHVSKRMGQRNHADLLTTFIRRRAGGEPLQYILGSEFFGNLEIQCRPGVLIPRWVPRSVRS
jgi:methylase of polypeptide subunit release factors